MTRAERIAKLIEMKDKNPSDSFLGYAIALEYFEEENIEDAKRYFEEVYQSTKNYLPLYFHFGGLLEKEGNMSKAKEIYLEGIALAKEKQDFKTLAELEEAIILLEDE